MLYLSSISLCACAADAYWKLHRTNIQSAVFARNLQTGSLLTSAARHSDWAPCPPAACAHSTVACLHVLQLLCTLQQAGQKGFNSSA